MYNISVEAFILYKYAYDLGLKTNKDINMDSFEEGLAIDILYECLDAVPWLTYDLYDCYIDDEGLECEDVDVFRFSHPLIVELGEFEREIRRGSISLDEIKTRDISSYNRLEKILVKEQLLINSICDSFYASSMYFSLDWRELHIAHDSFLDCCNLFMGIWEYLELLKEMIPLIRHINNRLF